MKRIRLILTLWFVFHTLIAWTQAYIPQSDAEILEIIPVATGEKQRLKDLRSELNKQPDDYALAINLARNYIGLGRTNSDPRYYGYAEAVLERWLKSPHAKPDAMVLQATILQNRHDFQSALAVLNNALNLNPRLPQALLTQAAIHEVQGNYPSALRSCLALARYINSLTATICVQSALSLSGQAQSSYQQLAAIVGDQGDPEELTWAYTILAELAERLSLVNEAEDWYQKALNQNFRSAYLLTSYADFLLDRNRPKSVIDLLKGEIQADTLLLRLTLAEQQLQSQHFNKHVNLIKDRIAAAQSRADKVHQGDEARFNLHILKDAQTALKLARANWEVQKEPRDARILLEAALAAKQPDASFPVIRFIEKTRLEDKRLIPLLNSLKG